MAAESERDRDALEDEKPDGTGVHGAPNKGSAPGQSSATGWDMDKTKPSRGPSTDSKPDDKQDSSTTSTESPGRGAGKQAGSTPARR